MPRVGMGRWQLWVWPHPFGYATGKRTEICIQVRRGQLHEIFKARPLSNLKYSFIGHKFPLSSDHLWETAFREKRWLTIICKVNSSRFYLIDDFMLFHLIRHRKTTIGTLSKKCIFVRNTIVSKMYLKMHIHFRKLRM